jgi:hypothetical protein
MERVIQADRAANDAPAQWNALAGPESPARPHPALRTIHSPPDKPFGHPHADCLLVPYYADSHEGATKKARLDGHWVGLDVAFEVFNLT